ncbi:helix-turn-helix domain-containing protein [Celeribacter sp. PS-C1]|nr:helix-turn-helix domain-containing protein [Celeribacter sp. PS-C1]
MKNDPLTSVFKKNLSKMLDKNGIYPTQLSLDIGSSRGYISMLLKGDHSPTLRTVEKIADALGVNWIDLLADQE